MKREDIERVERTFFITLPEYYREYLIDILRRLMYRQLSSAIPIVLCRETPEMWERYKGELNVGPANCGCGTVPRA